MLKDISPDRFLADYWQKQPLFLPSSIDVALPALGANELAWMATLPDVESRLVFTERKDARISYRAEHGPFTDAELNALPGKDWTLLVQDVDKHLPDFREYFRLVPFIPSWRIDDLMVSFAAPGGSVGPHKDNYDVFLCQGEGMRNWRVSDDRSVPDDASTTSLSLLAPFEPTEERRCESGDVLYVPPGIPHWGVAIDFCTTYSIGMRAPTSKELAAGYARILNPDADGAPDQEGNDDPVFYTDADLHVEEAVDGRIAIDSIRRLREQKLLDKSLSDEVLMTVLGSVATDPKAWLDPDRATADDQEKILQGKRVLHVHGMALIAWCQSADFQLVFVNGAAQKIPESGIELVRTLCIDRVALPNTIRTLAAEPEGPKFIGWLLDQGILDIG